MVGKFHPAAGLELLDSLPVIGKALLRGKVTPGKALRPPSELPKADRKRVKQLVEKIEGRDERIELNLYIAGDDEDEGAIDSAPPPPDTQNVASEYGQPGQSPEESPTR
jgi:hypothetical protein